MKKVILVIAVLSLLTVCQFAQATYLDSSWYVEITNVYLYGGNYSSFMLFSFPQSSEHIKIESNSSWNWIKFTIPQSGNIPTGETAKCGGLLLDEGHRVGSISFDYTTYWTQPNLILTLTSEELMYQDPPSQLVWSTSSTGLQSGHVTITGDPNGYYFRLTVAPEVPEPGGLLALGSLCAAGFAARMRRRGGQS